MQPSPDDRENALEQLAASLQPDAGDLGACWGIVTRGIGYHQLDDETLQDLIVSLREHSDFIVDELGFEFAQDRLRVWLLDDYADCDPEAMIALLERLRDSYAAQFG